MTNWQWSDYSTAIFDAFDHSDNNIIIQACPGSGKTTNAEELCRLAPSDKHVTALAFNVSIAKELSQKLPERINCRTVNSFGHSVLWENERPKFDKNKLYSLVRDHFPDYKTKRGGLDTRAYELVRATNMLRTLCLPNTDMGNDDFHAMLSLYGIDCYPGLLEDSIKLVDYADDRVDIVDYADQIRLPLIYNMTLPPVDIVIVDEAQDLNPLQLELLALLNCRYVFVGDTHQSIYAFRGAMSDSMQVIKERFSCKELPLSISYRCPSSVVNEAKAIYPDIEPAPFAIEGTVRYSERDNESYEQGDLVVCRNNAPVIELALSMLRQGKPCHVQGRDIGQGLKRLIQKQKAVSIGDLLYKLDAWRHNEVAKAKNRHDEAMEDRINDRFRSALSILNRCDDRDTPNAAIQWIDTIFESGKGAKLSTVHKAKGLEADRVFILDRYLMPSPYALKDWEKVQEKNVEYVAITRAKEELVYM